MSFDRTRRHFKLTLDCCPGQTPEIGDDFGALFPEGTDACFVSMDFPGTGNKPVCLPLADDEHCLPGAMCMVFVAVSDPWVQATPHGHVVAVEEVSADYVVDMAAKAYHHHMTMQATMHTLESSGLMDLLRMLNGDMPEHKEPPTLHRPDRPTFSVN